MEYLKGIWNKFIYSHTYQIVFEWWHFSGGQRWFFRGFMVVLFCGIVFAFQEIRIQQLNEEHRRKEEYIKSKYRGEIFSLQIELAQEKHNNLPTEERLRREELIRIFEESDKLGKDRRRREILEKQDKREKRKSEFYDFDNMLIRSR